MVDGCDFKSGHQVNCSHTKKLLSLYTYCAMIRNVARIVLLVAMVCEDFVDLYRKQLIWTRYKHFVFFSVQFRHSIVQ